MKSLLKNFRRSGVQSRQPEPIGIYRNILCLVFERIRDGNGGQQEADFFFEILADTGNFSQPSFVRHLNNGFLPLIDIRRGFPVGPDAVGIGSLKL